MSDILGIMEIAFKVHRKSRFELFSTVLSFGSSLSLILGAKIPNPNLPITNYGHPVKA